MRALIPGALCALLLAAAPAAAQDWLKKIPLAPKLTTRAEEPKPELPRYAMPDLPPDRKLIPDLDTPLVTVTPGLEMIVDLTGFGQDAASIRQVGEQAGRLEVRRAKIELGGQVGLGHLMSYKLGIDYNGFDVNPEQTFAITDFNVSFAIPAWRTKVSIGQMREDFGYEVVASTSILPQSERVISPFVSPVNTGLKVTHLIGARDEMTLSYGVFKDDWGDGEGRPAFSARMTRLVIDQPAHGRLLHLGLGVRRAEIRDTTRYRGRPGVAAADDFVDTGDFAADATTHVGLEALWMDGPLTVQAEHIGAYVDAPASGNPRFHGFYVLGSYVLTGEQRGYDRTKGAARRIVPLGRWGAPELVARLAAVDLSDGTVDGGRYWRLEMGANWWATTRWKFGMLYGHVRLDRFGETGRTNSLLTRVQWIY